MAKINRYVLGSAPEIDLTFMDESGKIFSPILVRLSIKDPTGAILTLSGADLTQGSGYLFTTYRPSVIGYYAYEGWGRDGTGHEIASSAAFEVYDDVY